MSNINHNPNDQIPSLTTKETVNLRADYPSIEHLEAGNVAAWLVERQDQLLMRAKTGRAEMNLSKLITLGTTAVGAICYATSPLAPVGAIFAGVGYTWAVGRDLNDSHQFAPFPFVRGDFFEFISAMGDSVARDEWFSQKNELLDLVHHLDPFERYEFAMLRDFGAMVSDYLQTVESGKKFYAYRWLTDRYIDYKGTLPSKDSLVEHLVNVQADPRINVRTVQALEHAAQQRIYEPPQPKFVDVLADQQSRVMEPVHFERDQLSGIMPDNSIPITTSSPLVGRDTKLDAINVPSIPIVDEDNQPIDHKHQWINKILKLPFRVISGEQGSGKSTLERWMISLLKTSGYHVIVVNPETNPIMWKGVEVLSTASEINDYFDEFIQGVRDRQYEARQKGIDEDDYFDYVKSRVGRQGLTAVFLMESNTYEVHGVDPILWANFLKQCLTNIRKWGFTACLTAHSDNQTSVASQLKGFSKLMDAQPRIDCVAKADPITGEATSSGKGLLKMKGVSDPNPQIISLVNYPKTKDFRGAEELEVVEAQPTVEQEIESTQSKPKTKLSDAITSLENSFKLEPTQVANSPEVEGEGKIESGSDEELSQPALLVLSFFDNAKIKSPKSIKELKDANKLRPLDYQMLLMALRELVVKQQLTFDEEGRYFKPDWQ